MKSRTERDNGSDDPKTKEVFVTPIILDRAQTQKNAALSRIEWVKRETEIMCPHRIIPFR